jgi:hypothetical protein
MKPLFLFSLVLVGGLVLGCQNTQSIKPNVIIILTDDQGYGDFSCHGNPVLTTSGLDKLYGVFSIEYEHNWDNNVPEIARSIEYFNKTVTTLE